MGNSNGRRYQSGAKDVAIASMHRGGIELLLDALESIEPLECMIEFGAFLLLEFRFHFRDLVGKLTPIEFGERRRN